MKVILLKDVKALGKRGEIVVVKNGFGRNYLVPNGVAEPATSEAVMRTELRNKKKQEEKLGESVFVSKLVKKVNKKKFMLPVKVSSGGIVYGSMDEAKVVEILKEQWKIKDRNVSIKLSLAQAIKEVGKYSIDVVISGSGVSKEVNIILEVVSE
ncbi:MAG: 50S ribosomal protein L9 [Patescibacteria group bacterium]|nr:50S ribosomal protein L9 [Patescibacteria group bacterium]